MPARKPPVLTISARMVVENLKEQQKEVDRLRAELNTAIELRDASVQDLAEFVPQTLLVRVTGLSREHIRRITNKAGQAEH